MGVFITGAYQEILGDLHNLFGDTDAVHVSCNDNGYSVDHVVEGDEMREVLAYVEYSKADLIERIRKSTETGILNGSISRSEAKLLLQHYERGLSSYTYLSEEEPETPKFQMTSPNSNKETSNGTNQRIY